MAEDSVLEIVEEFSTTVEVEEDVYEVVTEEVYQVVDVDETKIEIVDVGIQGPQGIPGTGAGHYYHIQAGVSDTWVINHDLGYRPNVTSFNSADAEVEGDVFHNSANQLTITFTSAFSGYAVVS